MKAYERIWSYMKANGKWQMKASGKRCGQMKAKEGK